MIIQLNPPIPVHIAPNPASFPEGKALAILMIDYSCEHQVLFGVAYDDGGAIYWVPTIYVRLQFNPSLGRNP